MAEISRPAEFGLGKNPNSRREIRQAAAYLYTPALKNNDKFHLARSLQ
jgi:hypothetical protein